MTNHVPEGSGWGTGVPGPTRANGRLAPGLRALAAPRPLALPQPLAALPPPHHHPEDQDAVEPPET